MCYDIVCYDIVCYDIVCYDIVCYDIVCYDISQTKHHSRWSDKLVVDTIIVKDLRLPYVVSIDLAV